MTLSTNLTSLSITFQLTSVVKIVDLIEGEKVEEKTSNNRGKKSQKHSEEYKYMPDTYEGCKDRFGIIFCDVPSVSDSLFSI